MHHIRIVADDQAATFLIAMVRVSRTVRKTIQQ